MANWCLIKEKAKQFRDAFDSGEINPANLSKMTSEERHNFLKDYVGEENAKQVNSLFESKLLLKNQKQGFKTWAERVAGVPKQVKRDLISKIDKLDRVLNPEEETGFLKDLASTKLGADITQEEAKNIFDLSQKVKETRTAMDAGGSRMGYGRAKIKLANYVNDLKLNSEPKGLGKYLNPIKAVSSIAGNAKSLKASLDDSAIFRQGWKTLMTHPKIWAKNAVQTFGDAVKEFGGQNVMDEINADIISRKNYDRMVKAKLAVGTIEESFPGTVAEKIPLIGRVYKASETAYTGFVHRVRADVFDKYIQIARKSGLNIDDPHQLESIGKLVNSLTGRGHLGGLEPAGGVINNIFFSPRLLKSHIDTLLLHPTDNLTGFARKEAAINLLKIVAGTAGVLATANAVLPGSVDFDPRSADFGKIKVGNTRFDVSGGMSGVVTLASRLISQSSKSSTTGKVTPLNSGKFGAQTGTDVIYNFFENKLSPVASVVKDLLKGQDFNGNKPTVPNELQNLFVPLGISNYQELQKDPDAANTLIAMIADGLGISVNTYSASTPKKWGDNPTKEQEAFLNRVGQSNFDEANSQFNTQYDNWFRGVVKTPEYQNLSEEGKQALTTKAKAQIQDKVFYNYGFKYATPTKTRESLIEKNTIKQLTP